MPYYAWKGVNLQAQWAKGTLFARNEHELDDILFKKDIALLYHKPKKLWWCSYNQQQVLHYFVQLQTLIKAGVMVPEALNIVARQTTHPYFASICYDVADKVARGHSLAAALACHPQIFNPVIVQSISVGQESGSLPQTLEILVHYLDAMVVFKKKIRAALMLPAITFLFFLMVIAVIVMVIVPQFVNLCASMHKQLPPSTYLLQQLSNFLRSGSARMLAAALGIGLIWLYRYSQTASGKQRINNLMARIPLVRALIRYQVMAVFFRSVAKLMMGGMPLSKALTIACESVEYGHLQEQLKAIAYCVDAGIPFHQSAQSYPDLMGANTLALIAVGHETGMLAPMMMRIADTQQESLLAAMHRITTLIQPLLLIILGLMISALIVGLYAPIMSLSSIF